MAQPTHSNADVDGVVSQTADLASALVPDLTEEIPPELLVTKTFVGAGGFGDVYRLEHPARGVLAIKQIKESGAAAVIERQRRHARQEAAIWYGLDHPHVLKLAGILEWERNFCFVCPFFKHGSLMEYLQVHPEATLDRINLIIECLGAVSYLHRREILHGDIKAANLLLSDDLHIQVCDFGLSRSIDVATSTAVTGQGSARWMSPELIDGEPKSFASDVWAVGMTMYEILSGSLPFKQHMRDSPIFLDIAVKKKLPPLKPTQSPDGESYEVVWASVSECWNYDPVKRPSVDSLHQRVESLRPTPPPALLPLSIRHGIPDEDLARLPQEPRKKVTVLSPHTDRVVCVVFSPDNRTVASGSRDWTIRLWDVARAVPLGNPLEAHTGDVNSVAFSPDNTTIVSGSADRTLRLWDVATGQTIGEPLIGHTHWVWSVAFAPDGRTIASSSGDKTIRIWDSVSRLCVAVLVGHTDWVMSVAFSPNGRTLMSGSDDFTVRRWDMVTYAQVGEPMKDHNDGVQSVVFAPDGSTIASGSDDLTISLRNAWSGGRKGSPLAGHRKWVFSLACHPNSRLLASGSGDHTIRIWDLTTTPPTTKIELKDSSSWVTSVAFSPDGRWLASGSVDKKIRLWDLKILLGTI